MQIFQRDKVPLEKAVDILARVSVAEADAFIGCWQTKYQYDLVRPLTYHPQGHRSEVGRR